MSTSVSGELNKDSTSHIDYLTLVKINTARYLLILDGYRFGLAGQWTIIMYSQPPKETQAFLVFIKGHHAVYIPFYQLQGIVPHRKAKVEVGLMQLSIDSTLLLRARSPRCITTTTKLVVDFLAVTHHQRIRKQLQKCHRLLYVC